MNIHADQFIHRAIELQPFLRGKAQEIERNRRVGDDVVAALSDAGLFSAIAPRRWGGGGLPLSTMVRVCEEVGRGDASTGWVLYILSFGAWIVSLLSDEGQEEVCAQGVPRVGGIGGPPGTAHRVDGGYIVNGRWGYASGCHYAQWTFLVVTPDDKPAIPGGPPTDIAVVAPMSEIAIEDTWFVSGMRGTGSNTLVAKDVFIPDRRILQVDPAGGALGPERRHSGEPSDYWPFWPTLIGVAAAPLVGMAQALCDLVAAGTGKRGITYTSYQRQSDSHIVVRDLAEAAVRIQSARALLCQGTGEIDAIAAARGKMGDTDRARFRGQIAYLSKLLRDTGDSLMSIAGASGFAEASPLQRLWRDLGLISRHAFLNTNPGLEVYGRTLLGLPPIGPI